MEAIVFQRFDYLGLRIWRCLFLQGQLEQKSIKDHVLGDQKVCPVSADISSCRRAADSICCTGSLLN